MSKFDFKKLAHHIPDTQGNYRYTDFTGYLFSDRSIERTLQDLGISYIKKQVAKTAWVLDVGDPDYSIHVWGKNAARCHKLYHDMYLDRLYAAWDKTLLADALKQKIATEMNLSKEELKLLKWKL